MESLIIVTILPTFIILTSYLFNIGTKEAIDNKYGINAHNFKPISYAICIMSIMIAFMTIVANKISNKEIKVNKSGELYLTVILVLCALYFIMYLIFGKKREEVFNKSNKYKPNKKIYRVCLFVSLLTIAISTMITSNIFFYDLKTAYSMLINKPEDRDVFFLVSLFIAIINIYIVTILLGGYIFGYGLLYSFKKYKIIFEDEMCKKINILDITGNKNCIEAYIIGETEKNMIIKAYEVDNPAIIVKKEHVVQVLFIDESQDISINYKEKQLLTKNEPLKNQVQCKDVLKMGLIIGIVIKLTIFSLENYIIRHRKEFMKLTVNYKIGEFTISMIIVLLIVVIIEALKGKETKKNIIEIIKKYTLFTMAFIIGIIVGGNATKFILKIINTVRLIGSILGIVIGKWLVSMLKNKKEKVKVKNIDY